MNLFLFPGYLRQPNQKSLRIQPETGIKLWEDSPCSTNHRQWNGKANSKGSPHERRCFLKEPEYKVILCTVELGMKFDSLDAEQNPLAIISRKDSILIEKWQSRSVRLVISTCTCVYNGSVLRLSCMYCILIYGQYSRYFNVPFLQSGRVVLTILCQILTQDRISCNRALVSWRNEISSD